MTHPALHMLCQGHSSICIGSLDECIREADKLGFLRCESDGYYVLTDGANIRVYRPSGHLGWIARDEVEDALKEGA